MSCVKVAISVPQSLSDQVDKVVAETSMPRSRLFCQAMDEYLRRRRVQQLEGEANAIYPRGLTQEDRAFLAFAEDEMRLILRGEQK